MANPADDMARILAKGRRPRRLWLWVLMALVLGVAGGGAWFWLRQDAGSVSYETETVSRGQLVVTVTATGSVQPTTQVDVSSELSGALAEVAVDFNDRVEVGQVLARLDDTKLTDQILTAEAQLQAAKASLEQAEAAAREAEVTYDSQSELDKRGQSTRLKMIAVEVARDMIAPDRLAGVHVFFPDPWPKARHHKRRLIQPAFVALLASRIAPGGYLHCATDWAHYAEQMLEVLSAEPLLRNTAETYAPRPAYRPLTKFEQRGIRLGHEVFDLVFTRR